MLDQISNVYIGSNISNRLYSSNDFIWPNTTGNLWNIIDNPYGKTISNFNVIYNGGQVDINWGKTISGNINTNTNINHTFSGITRSGISIISKNGANITQINCGTSSPKLSGTINLSSFPNLQTFVCDNNDITAINGYTSNTNIQTMQFNGNKVTGSIPSLNAMTNLKYFFAMNNNFSGSLPSFSSSVLEWIRVGVDGDYTGPKISGAVPSLNSLPSLTWLELSNHNLSGPLPALNNNPNLQLLQVGNNPGLNGNIPSFSNNLIMTVVHVFGCSFTGFAGGTVTNILEQFYAFSNQLTAAAVNAILAALVTAGRTSANGKCECFLDGAGNAAPTGQGISDVITLRNRGWIVHVN